MTRRLLLLWAGSAGLVLVVVAVGLVAGRGGGAESPPDRPLSRVEPYAAPEIAGPAVDGSGPVALSTLRGEPTLVNFWASWCAPCRREAPLLKGFAERHPGLRVLGVAGEGRDPAARFAGRVGWAWPTVADPDERLRRRFRVPGLPATFFIDAEGRVRGRVFGELTQGQLEEGARLLGV